MNVKVANSSAVFGGAGSADDARIAAQTRQRSLAMLMNQIQLGSTSNNNNQQQQQQQQSVSTVRDGALALTQAALTFGRGLDRRFLGIMQEFSNGSIDRKQVIDRFNELFSDTLVEPNEGVIMRAALQTLRARATS